MPPWGNDDLSLLILHLPPVLSISRLRFRSSINTLEDAQLKLQLPHIAIYKSIFTILYYALDYLRLLLSMPLAKMTSLKCSRSCGRQNLPVHKSRSQIGERRRLFVSAISPTLSSLGQSVPGRSSEKSPSFPGWNHPRFCFLSLLKGRGARSAAMTRALTVKQPSIERLAHRMAVTLTSLERLSLFLLCVCDGKLPSLLSAGTKLHCRGINVEKHARATSDT